jgi:hypothetical protein
VSGEQVLVLLLLTAAFAAGWFARGGSVREEDGAAAEPDPLLGEADETLGRALTAARAARSMAGVSGDAGATARQAALGVLDRRLDELEAFVDRLEERLGGEHQAFLAYDRAVSDVLGVRRQVTADGALEAAVDAQAEWRRVAALPGG